MTSAGRLAKRESYSRCPETCPSVDKAFDALLKELRDWVAPYLVDDMERAVDACRDEVKHSATIPLRDALVDACFELLEKEEA